jgi:hypothetical protein
MNRTAATVPLLVTALAIILRAFLAASSGASEPPVAPPARVDLFGASIGFSLRPGDLVTARTATGVFCGSCVVTNPGFYGPLHVWSDDPTTPELDGALPGQSLRLEVNGERVRPAAGDPLWTRDGDCQRVNIAR